MDNKIIRLLKEAKKARQRGIFNDKYTVETCLTEVCGFVEQALQLALQSVCSTCKGTKQVPTKQSIGFGAANHIMEECPDCLEGEFLKQTRELLRKCDRSRYLQVQHLGASIWSNVIWKRLDRACTYILRIEKQNRDIKQQQDKLQIAVQNILDNVNRQIDNDNSKKTIPISVTLLTDLYTAIQKKD